MFFKKSFFACIFLPSITLCSYSDFRLEAKSSHRTILNSFHDANQKAFAQKNLGPLTRILKQKPTLVCQYSNDEAMQLLILAIKKDNSVVAKTIARSGKIAPDGKDQNGLIPIDWTIQKKSLPLLTLLLKNGIDPNAHDAKGNHPLKIAMLKREKKLIRALLRSASYNPDIFDEQEFQDGFVKIKNHMKSVIARDPIASLIWKNKVIHSMSPIKSNEFGWSPLRAALTFNKTEFINTVICDLAEKINAEQNPLERKKTVIPIVAILKHPNFSEQDQLIRSLLINSITGAFFANTISQIQKQLDYTAKKWC